MPTTKNDDSHTHASLDEQRVQEAISLLKTLSEDDLRVRVVLPLFARRRLKCTSVDRRHERQHRCDILMEYSVGGESFISGVQLKANESILSKKYVDREIERASAVATKFEHLLSDGTRNFLSKYYWITTGDIDPIGQIGINECFGNGTPYFRQVDVWGVERLVAEVQKTAPELLPPLELMQIESGIENYRQSGQGVFAAHLCYQAFQWHLRQPEINFAGAEQRLRDALVCLDQEKHRGLYYYRLLKEYYGGLLSLLGEVEAGRIPWRPGRPLSWILSSEEALSHFDHDEYRRSALLLRVVESIQRQLDLLLGKFVVSPAPLTPIQICRLLLRFGYPPSESPIALCIQNMEERFAEEGQLSIDGKCSLCTSTAVSCFSLAGKGKQVVAAVDWLGGLKEFRYCYLEGRTYGFPNEGFDDHALHYAATVLDAFLDWGAERSMIQGVKEVFFSSALTDEQGFYIDWMRFRNEDRFEICRYIFSAFLRLYLSGEILPKDQKRRVIFSLKRFVKAIHRDAEGVQKNAARFYASRTNLSSLMLGAILGVRETMPLAREVAGVLHRRAIQVEGRGDQLWDGSVERTLAFVEGIAYYWETILWLEEQGHDVSQLLPVPEEKMHAHPKSRRPI